MAVRVCEVCGEANEPSARFCRVCDAYLGWDSGAATLDGEPLTGTIPTVIDPAVADADADAAAAGPAPTPTPAPTETAQGTDAGAAPGATTAAKAATAETATAETGAAATTPIAATGAAAGAAAATQPGATKPVPEASAPGPSAPSSTTQPHPAASARIEAPEAVLDIIEATVGPGAPVTVVLRLTNPSSIVDGYAIEPVSPPQWLEFSHGDTHLMPDQELAVPLELGLRADVLVLAQRVALTFRVSSQADPDRSVEVALQLTVPPLGPSATLEVRPSLIRLEDHAAGEFSVRLDNRAANFPQTVRLTAADAEGVVRFAFAPDVVTVPPGQVVELEVSFTAPEPEPGRELSRQITVEAGNDAGRAAVPLTLVQRTAAEPVDAPVRVRIEPSSLRVDRGNTADFDVLLDHRGGHKQVTLSLAGRDPGRAIGFAFSSAQVVLEPGAVAHVRGRLAAPAPPRGGTVQYPFSVVASDGVQDVEAAATVELTSPPEPILTAAIRLDPPSQLVVNERQAVFQVTVDNRRGVDPLGVRLEGASEDGTARLTFTPAELVVPPGQGVVSRLVVDAPRPEPSESATRRFRVIATDGVHSIEADAALTQASADRRPVTSRILVTIGGLLVLIGAFAEWFANFPPFLPSVDLIGALVRGQLNLGDITLSEPPIRVWVILFGALMLLGMIGKSGRLTRVSAVLIVLVTVAWLIFLAVAAFVPPLGLGLFLIWIGCVLGFVGGILARPRPEN
ncbi:hypothetical protein [Agromyces sp. Leaf222]|uniref:hypothetical protein n=1 Tax=Agromyces sp. Leaf222 TaxID=1735688 RepID=UPI0006FB47B9|nr:hypothetical protein [Agromyces sp. Leaf222]KQM81335.1 hypothetical protein ASE68_16250 [Agromyces sp. Leaf222]